MFENSVSSAPSIWTFVTSWLTPSVLFVLLNLVIGTIYFTSNRKQHNPRNPDKKQPNQPIKFGRSPSVLHRFKSINLYFHSLSPDPKTHYHYPPSPAAGALETETSPRESQDPHCEEDTTARDLEEEFNRAEEPQIHVARTMSDKDPASGIMPAMLRKSASTMSAFSHFEEEEEEEEIVEARRPATVREGKTEVDDEVDAKADDFINRFKQQLKLQRLDSILKYKDRMVRGTGM